MKAGSRRITPENDLRLSRHFRTEPGLFFLRLQLAYKLEKARRENLEMIEAIEPIPQPIET